MSNCTTVLPPLFKTDDLVSWGSHGQLHGIVTAIMPWSMSKSRIVVTLLNKAEVEKNTGLPTDQTHILYHPATDSTLRRTDKVIPWLLQKGDAIRSPHGVPLTVSMNDSVSNLISFTNGEVACYAGTRRGCKDSFWEECRFVPKLVNGQITVKEEIKPVPVPLSGIDPKKLEQGDTFRTSGEVAQTVESVATSGMITIVGRSAPIHVNDKDFWAACSRHEKAKTGIDPLALSVGDTYRNGDKVIREVRSVTSSGVYITGVPHHMTFTDKAYWMSCGSHVKAPVPTVKIETLPTRPVFKVEADELTKARILVEGTIKALSDAIVTLKELLK